MDAWIWLALAFGATALPAFWMWTVCRERVALMEARDLPPWRRLKLIMGAVLGGATAVVAIGATQAARAAAGRK
jgi:hypothetical protein